MKTLLIVDDSRIFRMVLEKILAPHFKIVGRGDSGEAGIELYKTLKPDLVVMDITMPNCSGKEALGRIMGHDPAARIIMVSGLGDEQTVKECMEMGAKAFVKKEFISQTDQKDSLLVQTACQVVERAKQVEAA